MKTTNKRSSKHVALLSLTQRYRSMSEFVLRHNIMLPRPHATWRLLDLPVRGGINGIDRTFNGIAMATNGIIVAIVNSADKVLFGHLQWFYKDDPDEPSDLDLAMAAVIVIRKKMQCVDTFEDLFQDEVNV